LWQPTPPNSPAPSRLHFISARQAGRHLPLLTELETLFDFGCYKYAAPAGAENESQRDSNPSAQGWRFAPAARSAAFMPLHLAHVSTPKISPTPSPIRPLKRAKARAPSENPNGIQFIIPRLAVRAGRRGARDYAASRHANQHALKSFHAFVHSPVEAT
jgi:hypothetical protein